MPQSDDHEKPGGSRWESEVIRAARRAEQCGLGDMWDLSGRMFDAIRAEVDARAEFQRAGITWPTECPEFWSRSDPATVFPREPIAFVRERWGEGLIAVLRKRRSERTRMGDPLDSPTIRRLLLIVEQGVRERAPELERVARSVAMLFGPLPGKGNRTRVSLEDEDKRSHAAFLWVRFKVIFRWLDSDMPEETDPAALLARLQNERPYVSAVARVCRLGGAGFLFEPEMLPFVAGALAEHRCSDGQRAASAIRKGFTEFCVRVGLASKSAIPASFVNSIQRWMRENWSE